MNTSTTQKENAGALKGVRRMLGLGLDSWNSLTLICLALTALAAIGIVVSQLAVNKLQKAEALAEKVEFEKYKAEADTKLGIAREEAKAAVEKAHADIANANRAIAEARTETAKSNERTKELELALEERKNRQLTDAQRMAVIERLKPLPNKGKVLFNPLVGDGEALQFSEQIKAVLKEAGYEVENVPEHEMLLSLNRTGAFLWYKDKDKEPTRAANIATAFRLVGITIWGEPQVEIADPDTLILVVATHP